MSCSRSVDKRLVLADTLMWVNPDSSLAILNAINRDSLQGEENLAYHALLLTQAQFRVDYAIPSDSLINFAVEYYSDNHNREHYTRSLLYKGAFFEVHDNPVEAIKWYKQAEDNADTADYHNLAQINMRIGMIYHNNYISTGEDIIKFKRSLYYYRKLGYKKNEMLCLLYIGEKLRVSNDPNAIDYLDQSKRIAIELKDTVSIVNAIECMARNFIYNHNYEKAYRIAQSCINSYPTCLNEEIIFDAARACALLGKIDSASMYMNLVKSPLAYDVSHVYRLYTIADIALARGDNMLYIKNKKIADSICDVVQIKRDSLKLTQAESIFNEQKMQLTNSKKELFRLVISLLIGSLLLVSIIFLLLYFKKKKDSKRLIDEIRNENSDKYDSLNEELVNINSRFAKVMLAYISVLKNIMAQTYKEPDDYQSKNAEHKVSPIDDSDKEFWNGLYDFLNLKHNNIIKRIEKKCPRLSPAEINIIGLICCGFNDAEIAVCKGYRNAKSVTSKRNKIKDKMHLDILLNDYLKQMM